MSSTTIDLERIQRIFFPYHDKKIGEAKESKVRFVYYTTADTAMSILKNREIWLRNATTMNDYMEVDYGFECLNATYKAEPGQNFKAALETCFAGLVEELESHFNSWLPTIRRNTYMTCLSEHMAEEDQYGRLSMWRAYGGKAGIALVINPEVMQRETNVLKIYSSPVAYFTRDEFKVEFLNVVRRIGEEAAYIRSLGRDRVRNILFNMFRFTVLCIKHPGFREEREWRIITSPEMDPSEFLRQTIQEVHGTPQLVLKLDLQNHPDQCLVGLALPDLLNRIIIGPCEFPLAVYSAFLELLKEAEVPEPEKKISISDIPLRHP